MSNRSPKSKQGVVHVVIRFGDKIAGGVETIAEHERILTRDGLVWFGKIGRGLGKNRIAQLASQIESGLTTYAYFASRSREGHAIYRGKLTGIQLERPRVGARSIPRYYVRTGVIEHMGMWMQLSSLEEIDRSEKAILHIASSGKKLTSILDSSMAGAFVITRGGDRDGPSFFGDLDYAIDDVDENWE